MNQMLPYKKKKAVYEPSTSPKLPKVTGHFSGFCCNHHQEHIFMYSLFLSFYDFCVFDIFM